MSNSMIDGLRRVYVEEGRYERWDHGEAVGDSVTPAIYSADYRAQLLSLIEQHVPKGPVLSLGSGNCKIEQVMKGAGYDVLCTDILPESKPYAVSAGCRFAIYDALKSQIDALPTEYVPSRLVYADGLIGHLIAQEQEGLQRFLRSVLDLTSEYLLISNDECQIQTQGIVEINAGVSSGFYYVNGDYLERTVVEQGYNIVVSSKIPFERPLSGRRERVVILAAKREK